jgi:hypothetical protein
VNTLKISIDTDVDTYESAIRAVLAAFGVPFNQKSLPVDGGEELVFEDVEEEAPADDYLPGKWNHKRIRKLLSYVQDDAAEALYFIAQHAPAVDIEDVFEHMAEYTGIEGFNGKHMGGRMSSVGFAQKRVPGITADIVDTDYRYRKYRMDKGIAKVILEEMSE